MTYEGEPQLGQAIDMSKIHERAGGIALEVAVEATINYVGRIDFGRGNIDASGVTKEEAMRQAGIVLKEGLIPQGDYRGQYGGCMDGRDNYLDETGAPFEPRPKVIGGPVVFGWTVASIGGFSMLRASAEPLKQFDAVAERLVEAGYLPGMHDECGMARGLASVLRSYQEFYAQVASLAGDEAVELAKNKRLVMSVKSGLRETIGLLDAKGKTMTEPAMQSVVRDIGGPKALIRLRTDPKHPNHGHEEELLLRLRLPGFKIDKPLVIKRGVKAFYSNEEYARALVEVLAQTEEERDRGLIIADHLPLAGDATLGNGQHIIEIS